MNDNLAKKLESYLKKRLGINESEREEINILNIGKNSVGGLIVSKAFQNLKTSKQTELLESFLRDFEKENKMGGGIIPAIMTYSPEEYRSVNQSGVEGVLRSVSLNMFAGNDLIVLISGDVWPRLTADIDLHPDPDRRWDIEGLIQRKNNEHLFNIFHNNSNFPVTYSWFSCEGYYFHEISPIQVWTVTNDVAQVSFSGRHIPPWDLPSEE